MLKVRLMGTKNDIKWFGKILQRNPKIEVTVMEAIGRIEHLANRGNYEYTQEQVDEMFSIMENRLVEVKSRFAPKQAKNNTFSFGTKTE